MAGSTAGIGSLFALLSRCGSSGSGSFDAPRIPVVGRDNYGELQRTPDQNGDLILALPKDFSYITFGKIGATMSDGNAVPCALDGMTCIDWAQDRVRLIRNHEVRTDPGAFIYPATFSVGGSPQTRYDPLGVGGTVTSEFDVRAKRLLRDFISLNGTIINCSGGLAWRDSGWLTCEESVAGPNEGWTKKHGYVYFVPVDSDVTVTAAPFPWMGRFEHESASVDMAGTIYLTEDREQCGFYRATPVDAGRLERGGTLEMLAINGSLKADLKTGQVIGKRLPVSWVPIQNPDPELENGEPLCFEQGYQLGGAAFNRLEGAFPGPDGRSVYFTSTTGGELGYGQVWHYIPADGFGKADELVLVFQSQSAALLESPDNVCVTPQGGMLLCEDDAVVNNDTHPLAPQISEVNRLIGIGALGLPFEFAVNILNNTEFAGACFSPDGSTLFVNIYGNGTAQSGMTCAIWGPWERGPL